jgi:hypothetical protein
MPPFRGEKYLAIILHPCIQITTQKEKVDFIKGGGVFNVIVFSKLLPFYINQFIL